MDFHVCSEPGQQFRCVVDLNQKCAACALKSHILVLILAMKNVVEQLTI